MPWWNEVDNAARLLASQLNSAVTQAARDGTYTAPPGSPPPARRRRPASLRHLAEVIRTNRLAPGMSIDKDDVAAVLAGKPRSLTDPVLVAGGLSALLIAGASTALILREREAQRTEPSIPDAACRLGATGSDIIEKTTGLFDDDKATRLSPALDFDQMNGSARYARHDNLTYYWGRAGSDDHDPHAGGARVRWTLPDGRWRSCATALAQSERGYVHTPAVATTIGGQPVTVQVCLWRDDPRRENCTAEISNGR